jgi:3-oxoacyl-(acyl-carrier-protein) synthase
VVDAILSIHMMKNVIIPTVRPMGWSEDFGHVNLDSINSVQRSPGCVMINTRGYQGQCASLVITACR